MIERGIVQSINHNIITVKLNASEMCSTCNYASGCGVLNNKSPDRYLNVLNKKQLKLKPGDQVNIYLSPAKAIQAGFILFILPIILFIIFYLGMELFFPNSLQLFKIITGFIGIGSGFLIGLVINKLSGDKNLPEINDIFKTY